MAGHILKIQLAGAKPPVWRRVAVPEHITFKTMSDVINILFDWGGYHLHEFQFPKSKDLVVMDDYEDPYEMGGLSPAKKYPESETDLDDFLVTCRSIRYIYDFGDYWTHRITWEKDDPEYTPGEDVRTTDAAGRQISGIKLLKYKGDPYDEDSGGIDQYDEYSGIQHDADPEDIQYQLDALQILYTPKNRRHGGIRPQTQEEYIEAARAQMSRAFFGFDPVDYATQMLFKNIGEGRQDTGDGKKADVLQFPGRKDNRKE